MISKACYRRTLLKGGIALAALQVGFPLGRRAIAQTAVDTCVILCQFVDDAGSLTQTPAAPDFYTQYFFVPGNGGLFDYFRDVSNGRIQIVGNVFGWFNIGHNVGEHTNLAGHAQRVRAFGWALDAARANNVPVDNYAHQVVIINQSSDHGALDIGHRMLIAHGGGALFNHSFMQHEFGHLLGLFHSFSTPPDTEYGDDYCIMSVFTTPYEFQSTILGVASIAGPGLNAIYVNQLGGLSLDQIHSVPPDGADETVQLTPLGYAERGGALVARIPALSTRPSTYWVEFRHPSRWDTGIQQPSVVVHETRPNDARSFLLTGPTAKALRNPGEQVVTGAGTVIIRLENFAADQLTAAVRISVANTMSARDRCLEECAADRDFCMSQVGTSGGPLGRQCANEFVNCRRRCGP